MRESWSNEEPVFNMQNSPISQPGFTTTPAMITVPAPMEQYLATCAEG